MNNSDINIVDDIKRFLKFQSDLSGGLLFLNSKPSSVENKQPHVKEKKIINSEIKNNNNKYETTTLLAEGRSSPASQNLLSVREEWTDAETMDSLNRQIQGCMKCQLGKTRIKFVFGTGNPEAEIMVIGEAPGADEDRQGEPFVGRAGQLLTKILEAVDLKREEVFICNILKCRPPGNRDPQPPEVEQCEPYLHKQIELVKPKVILALGRIAAQTLLRTGDPLGSLRGRTHDYLGIPMIVVYHPAALLRNSNFKKQMWEDMKAFKNYYNDLTSG